MLWVRSTVLKELVERYEGLRAQAADVQAEPAVQDLLRDTSYTLCVATGSRDVETALAAARARMDETPDGGPGTAIVDGSTAEPGPTAATAEPVA